MAEERPHETGPQPPQPPEGLQRPGIPGAGNILDPAVRAQVRETLQGAVGGLCPHGNKGPGNPGDENPKAGEAETPAGEPSPTPKKNPGFQLSPFPHGDVDLSFIAANVPAEPVRVRRGRGNRRFYFLPDSEEKSAEAGAPSPPAPTWDHPKPG